MPKPTSQQDIMDRWDSIRQTPCQHSDPGSRHPCWDCIHVRQEVWADDTLAYLESLEKFFGMVQLWIGDNNEG